ncbi:MAG: HD domain-containing phosphohydrolase [Candidatus Binatia bacterium]
MAERFHALVVDDDTAVSKTLQEMLELEGYVATRAASGWDGLSKLEDGHFDVVFSDIRMPGMDGLEFLGRIKEYDPTLPVVMLTGYPEMDIAIQAMKKGAADFIPKPFTIEQIQRSMGELLKKKRLVEANSQLLNKVDSMKVIEGLNRKLTQKIKELSKFYSLNEALNFLEDQEVLFRRLVELAVEIAEAKKSVLLLLDKETRQLMIKAATGFSDSRAMDFGIPVESSMVGKSILKGKPFLVQIGEGDPFDKLMLDREEADNFSWLCVPLMVREEVIETLVVGEKVERGDFSQEDILFLVSLVSKAALTLENLVLYESFYANLVDTLKALVTTLEAKDRYTRQHSQRVTYWSVETARKMAFGSEEIEVLRFAGVLHDVGKIGIQDCILTKPGTLSSEEFNSIRSHPLIGERIVEPLGLLPLERGIIRHHHERWDGQGYPDGLAQENIPPLARILAVADAFDAITSDRPYRRAKSYEEAILELQRCSGTQFDKEVVDAFQEILSARHLIRPEKLLPNS